MRCTSSAAAATSATRSMIVVVAAADVVIVVRYKIAAADAVAVVVMISAGRYRCNGRGACYTGFNGTIRILLVVLSLFEHLLQVIARAEGVDIVYS